MRKCDACGYLLLGDGDNCNHCGAPLPAVSVAAPAANAPAGATPPPPPSPSWAAPSAPPPAAPPQPASRGAAPAWTPGLAPPPPPPPPGGPPRDLWHPEPVITTPSPAKKRHRGKIALVIVVAVLGAFVAYGAYARNQPPPGTADFVAGHGVDFTAADGSYTAQFPKDPLVETNPVRIQGAQLTFTSATVATDDYEIITASMALPTSIPSDRVDQSLDEAMDAGVQGVKGDLKSKHRITRGGLPAIDASFEAPDGYKARGLILLAGNHIDVLFVHAKTGVDKLFHALDQSFVPNVGV
jgi:hypothetical protein